MKAHHVKIFRIPATLHDHILSDINSLLIQTSRHKAAFSMSCPNSVAAGNNLCNMDFLVLPVGPIMYHMPSSQGHFLTISTSLYSQVSIDLSFWRWWKTFFVSLLSGRMDTQCTVYTLWLWVWDCLILLPSALIKHMAQAYNKMDLCDLFVQSCLRRIQIYSNLEVVVCTRGVHGVLPQPVVFWGCPCPLWGLWFRMTIFSSSLQSFRIVPSQVFFN